MKIIVTGGAGFIGSAVIRMLILETSHTLLNIDKLTYAGNLDSLKDIDSSNRYSFIEQDITNLDKISSIFNQYKPDAVMHLAAESHVDRSIDGPSDFINTNIIGTFNVLEASRKYFDSLSLEEKRIFRFHHISTDEVYGDLEDSNSFFTEETSYAPSSPYSASKASSDHLVRAWNRTYGLPVLITNCSNNYGPYHFPEKLIPCVVLKALKGEDIPVYGDGSQIRDWLYVDDHAKALIKVVEHGKIGETYNIGGHNEKTNIEVVRLICSVLEELHPSKPKGIKLYSDLITYVEDRPGHDLRYAIDASKIQRELGWIPNETFDTGIYKTVQWFLENKLWWERIINGEYRLDRMGIKNEKKY